MLASVVSFLTGLGPTVMLPILILILGLILGQKISEALRSALTIGVGFVGLNLVIGLLIGALAPATQALIERTGVNLTAMDVGWGVAAAIAFGTRVGALIVPLAFGINIVMLLTRTTRTLNVDIWNFWHYAFTGSLVTIITGSIPLGLVAAAIHAIVALKIADLTGPQVQEFFELPGVAIPQGWAITSVPIVLVMNKILDKIPGINKIKADPETVQKKLGVVGQPIFLGFILGAVFGLLAGYDITKLLQLSVSMAGVMLLVPRIIAIFMEGLVPLSESAKAFLQKRFGGREFYVGLDSAILIGHPVTIAAGILLIPITLGLAAILPGNTTLPFADLAATAFFVCMATLFTRGDLFRTTVIGAVIMIVVLYTSSSLAPLITANAASIGYQMPEGATTITALSGGNWIAWLLASVAKLLAK